jgi:hypothetical protein
MELLGGIGNFYPSCSRANLQLDKKCILDLVPSHMFSVRRNHKKILSFFSPSHATAQEEEVWGRHGGNPQIKPKIITSYSKFMCGINSSNMMLYTYLDERRTVHYVLFYIM